MIGGHPRACLAWCLNVCVVLRACLLLYDCDCLLLAHLQSDISNAAEILFICDETGGCAFVMALDAIDDYDRAYTDNPATEGVGSKGRTMLELDSPSLEGRQVMNNSSNDDNNNNNNNNNKV